MRIVLLLLICLLLGGCKQPLSVQTQYLSRENFASFHVKTPDPHLNQPIAGQRLVIEWFLPKCDMIAYKDLHLQITVRLQNREEVSSSVPIYNSEGIYLYSVGGVLSTYKVAIVGDGIILEEWKHPLWIELIQLDISEENPISLP